jgi:hypothetical protein
MAASQTEIITAYRTLHKSLLRAVRYSKPARFVVRDRVRNAFRTRTVEQYDAACIARTLEFLHGAETVTGLEHKILKNLVHVWWEEKRLRGQWV